MSDIWKRPVCWVRGHDTRIEAIEWLRRYRPTQPGREITAIECRRCGRRMEFVAVTYGGQR